MNLKEWRKKEALTQEEAGEKFGISNVTYSRWENGTRRTIRANHVATVLHNTNGDVDANGLYGQSPELIAELKANAAKHNI